MKYKVGDIVRVREDLERASMIRDVYVNSEMLELAGKLVTISQLDTDNCMYYIEEDDGKHMWISDFFEDEDDNKEEKSDEYEDVIGKVLSEMSEETKDILIKEIIKGENRITIVSVPVYEIVCRHNGIAIQQIVDTKYSVTVTNKDGVVKL